MARSQPESQNSKAHVERAEGEISSEKPNTVARQAPEQATDKAKASSDVLREDSETAKRDAQLAKTEIERFERRRSETQCRARAIGNGKKPQQKPKLTRWSPSHMAGGAFLSSFFPIFLMSFSLTGGRQQQPRGRALNPRRSRQKSFETPQLLRRRV